MSLFLNCLVYVDSLQTLVYYALSIGADKNEFVVTYSGKRIYLEKLTKIEVSAQQLWK